MTESRKPTGKQRQKATDMVKNCAEHGGNEAFAD
jgi:hypothetical protein